MFCVFFLAWPGRNCTRLFGFQRDDDDDDDGKVVVVGKEFFSFNFTRRSVTGQRLRLSLIYNSNCETHEIFLLLCLFIFFADWMCVGLECCSAEALFFSRGSKGRRNRCCKIFVGFDPVHLFIPKPFPINPILGRRRNGI